MPGVSGGRTSTAEMYVTLVEVAHLLPDLQTPHERAQDLGVLGTTIYQSAVAEKSRRDGKNGAGALVTRWAEIHRQLAMRATRCGHSDVSPPVSTRARPFRCLIGSSCR